MNKRGDVLSRVRRAVRAYERSREARDTAIRDAVAGGHSQRTVAKEAGLTHTRVQQILRKRP